ncbi:hypothetical protein ABT340_15675 [Streptosporangium sp. NPDC000239]|uniref:hypothetical protein n=1 Tax=Streptosporangium sp. NPDC000239 TaxID=3154248 RepID=UPI00332A3184
MFKIRHAMRRRLLRETQDYGSAVEWARSYPVGSGIPVQVWFAVEGGRYEYLAYEAI